MEMLGRISRIKKRNLFHGRWNKTDKSKRLWNVKMALVLLILLGSNVEASMIINGVLDSERSGQSVVNSYGGSSSVSTIVINFDDVTAPCGFIETTHLTDHYDFLGVHFSGPSSKDGGAILNQCGNFGVNALSGSNFLAFNRDAKLSDGGVPSDPEIILFDELMAEVSIYVAGGWGIGETFTMQAYDIAGFLVDTDTIATQAWGLLSVSWAAGIKKVVLEEIGGGDNAFVYDSLSLTPIPEPGTVLLIGLGGLGLLKNRKG